MQKRGIYKYNCTASVDGIVAATAEIMISHQNRAGMSNHDLIHSTAIIDPSAVIASDVQIGPYCIIGPQVTIGAGTKLHSHVVVGGFTRIY